jgi:hypothetical protein
MTKARSNAVANAAKGDLTVGNGTDLSGILAVGSNGDTLVADSSTSTGLRYTENFAAGNNKVINGDFNINQRAFTSTTAGGYNFDRWQSALVGGTVTTSTQAFTLGTAPVSGYEGKNFLRMVTSGQSATSDFASFYQPIESVRTFAGETVTVSLWAKAASGTPKIAFELGQFFGGGGSPSATVNNYLGQITLSTNWTRYSINFALPSISGKTLGTSGNDALRLNFWTSAGTDFNARTGSLGIQSNTFDIWGVQIEAGSVATAFQTATGTIQGELAACQRYYYRSSSSASNPYAAFTQFAPANSTTQAFIGMRLPVSMRTPPLVLEFANLQLADGSNLYTVTSASLDNNTTTNDIAAAGYNVASGLTQYRPYVARGNNSASAYIGFSAEL